MVGNRLGTDLLWLLVGALLAVAVMVFVRTTGIPPAEGPLVAVAFLVGGVGFAVVALVVLVRAVGLRGAALLRVVVLLLAGATLWDGVAIAAAPDWYGGEGPRLATSAAMILFGAGVLLLGAVAVADRDRREVAPVERAGTRQRA
jgi:hypothetical protein